MKSGPKTGCRKSNYCQRFLLQSSAWHILENGLTWHFGFYFRRLISGRRLRRANIAPRILQPLSFTSRPPDTEQKHHEELNSRRLADGLGFGFSAEPWGFRLVTLEAYELAQVKKAPGCSWRSSSSSRVFCSFPGEARGILRQARGVLSVGDLAASGRASMWSLTPASLD